MKPFSPQEEKVARLIAAGMTNVEIAEVLELASQTVDSHVAGVKEKLGTRGIRETAIQCYLWDQANPCQQ